MSEKIVRIEMEHSDGRIQRLTGADAERWVAQVNGLIGGHYVRYNMNPLAEFEWEWSSTEQPPG